MLMAEAVSLLMGFTLCISGVQVQEKSICAFKGASVELPCSAQAHTSSMQWFTVHWDDSKYVLNELSPKGDRILYMPQETDFSLKIKDVTESDANNYCCSENFDQPAHCMNTSIWLQVADLQVKVIPATEGQTVTLMCSTSCPLTENPAAYIWYKNREFLYQDWSPWYQHLVSSEKAVTYSCAIKGYEHLRAPEVSVDSITSTCFSVTYAKGRMCSHNHQTSVDEPCSITYPRDLQVIRTTEVLLESVTLTCNTSCPMADPQTTFRWYGNTRLHSYCESQDITLLGSWLSHTIPFSCAVKGHEDLHSDQHCMTTDCQSLHFPRRICALEGSSVNISRKYSSLNGQGVVPWDYDPFKNKFGRTINNLTKNDSGDYIMPGTLFGLTLVVTDVKVECTPSAVVTEGQRVTLTCSTSCPLTDNTNYIWFLNSRHLTENQNKQLVLDPVSSQHAGNYSCAVHSSQNTSSLEEALTVIAVDKSVLIMNAVRLTLFLLILPVVLLLYLKMRKMKTLTSSGELSDTVKTGRMDALYECIPLRTVTPVAQREPTQQQESTV